MNALVKKEIRLLLPTFLIGCGLTISNLFLPHKSEGLGVEAFLLVLPFVFCPAMAVMLALNSFGTEVSSGTFSMLLAQPVPRQTIWQTKISLLALSLFIIGFLWCGFSVLWLTMIHRSFQLLDVIAGVSVFGLVVFSGGLWTVLLLRQVAAAFWFTVLVPGVILAILAAFIADQSDEFVEGMITVALGIYSLAGLVFARWLFFRAQDVAWTGGVINFSRWRYFESGAQSNVSPRRRQPIAALLKKELQLHSISLFCAGALLVLHIGVFFLRIFYANSHRNSLAADVSYFFWALWLVIPLVIGCTAVAEERKLGVAEGQFCLPVSRPTQFAIKFIPTMIFGTLLGGIMPLLLEMLAGCFGAPNEYFRPESHANGFFGSGLVWFQISIVALAAGLAWAGFFASTLAKNFLLALDVAIMTVLGCVLFTSFIAFVIRDRMTFFGITPWHWKLPFLIAIPTIPAALLWLAWLNFNHFSENWRLWRRNLLGLTGAVVFVIAGSAAIYNRAWEVFEPAEPPHGPAEFSLSAPPKLQSDIRGNLLVRLPDGRVWFDSLDSGFHGQFNRWNEMRSWLAPPLPKSSGPWQFIEGSNWVSTTASGVNWWDGNNAHVAGFLDTVGVKDDGSLWISAESKPEIWTGAKMVRFGGETNWQQVVGSYNHFLLLKKDDTLWQWGTNHLGWSQSQWQTNWPSVRAFEPRQIGTNSDWKEIFPVDWLRCARKANGSFWIISENYKTGEDELKHSTNFDQAVFQTLSLSGDGSDAYIGKDGTLWAKMLDWEHGKEVNPGFQQIGKESNWVSVTVNRRWMIALKSDGSLWKWNIEWDITSEYSRHQNFKIPPTRLGIHNDWVAIGSTWGGVVSLAADGSLWLWPGANYNELALLKCPKQPEFLGNVFGKAD